MCEENKGNFDEFGLGDVTGKSINAELVELARQEEMEGFQERDVHR